MPRIFDNNITAPLLPALQASLAAGTHADFCVGYFNLRGWKDLGPLVEDWPGGAGSRCRVLVGMQPPPEESLRRALSVSQESIGRPAGDKPAARRTMAKEFRRQLTFGAPTNQDEDALRQRRGNRISPIAVSRSSRHFLTAKAARAVA